MHKRILLLGADISDNALGRAWILADMLSATASVRIAGLSSRGGVWPPLAGNERHPVDALAPGRFFNLCGTWRLLRYVWGAQADIIYICKPKFPNLVAGLLGARGRRVVLDNDDWEAGCARGGFSPRPWVNRLAARGISFTQLADWMIPLVKHRTVSNVFLQARYGGTVVPHARDGKAFVDVAALKEDFGLPGDARIVMFFGTPHRHKGVDQLIAAMGMAQDRRLLLVVAGLAPGMEAYADYAAAANGALAGRYRFLPFVAWDKAPALLACADILVVPQKETLFTRWGQTPAKVFDAMAAGKPLVVSRIADTEEIVGTDAWLVPPDSAQGIAQALDEISADWAAAQAKGQRLRERFLSRYSYQQVAPVLAKAVLG